MADDLLPREVAAWLASDADDPLMPPSVALAVDSIPERTPAQIDEIAAKDAALTASLADRLTEHSARLLTPADRQRQLRRVDAVLPGQP